MAVLRPLPPAAVSGRGRDDGECAGDPVDQARISPSGSFSGFQRERKTCDRRLEPMSKIGKVQACVGEPLPVLIDQAVNFLRYETNSSTSTSARRGRLPAVISEMLDVSCRRGRRP